MRHKSYGLRRFPFFILVVAVIAAAAGGAVMLLWNAVLPGVTSTREITYPQALGLLVLCRILFGGFGRGGGRPWSGGSGHWRGKWRAMSEEDRARFKEEWKQRCAQQRRESEQSAEDK